MAPVLMDNRVEKADDPDRLRAIIPHYLRAGLLRRTGLPDGGIQFVEVFTDMVFATLDGQGRFVTRGLGPNG